MSKIPFKNYINFRQFFFEIINSWDSTFTDDDSEKFLKNIQEHVESVELNWSAWYD